MVSGRDWGRLGLRFKVPGPGSSTTPAFMTACLTPARAGTQRHVVEVAMWVHRYLCDKLAYPRPPFIAQVWLDLSEKEQVYEQYKQFMRRAGFSHGQGIIGYAGFAKVWNKYFPWLHTAENKKIKSKCIVCEDLEVRQSTRRYR